MKPLFLLGFLLMSIIAGAQTPVVQNPCPRTISVSGSAELAVTPDEIYITVTLREYTRKGQFKQDLNSLSEKFLAACKSAGIPDSAITVVGLGGDNDSWYWASLRRKPQEMEGEITYEVKVSRFDNVAALAGKLDDYGTGFRVSRISHSNAAAFRKQLKIDAVKAAKEKARYLAEAIGETVGPAMTITEPGEEAFGSGTEYSVSQVLSNSLSPGAGAENAQVGGVLSRKIKYRYEVKVVFALK